MRSDTLKQQENVFRVAYFFQTSWARILQLLTESCFESRETFFEKHIFHFALRDALYVSFQLVIVTGVSTTAALAKSLPSHRYT